MGLHGRLFRTPESICATLQRINPNKVVGERLCKIRTDRDMTQQELAIEVNKRLNAVGALGLPLCGQSAISKVESGDRSMSALEMLATAEVLRVPPETFAPWQSGEYDYRTV